MSSSSRLTVTDTSSVTLRNNALIKLRYPNQYFLVRLSRYDNATQEIYLDLLTNPLLDEQSGQKEDLGNISSYGLTLIFLKNSLEFLRTEKPYQNHGNIQVTSSILPSDVVLDFTSIPGYASLANLDGNSPFDFTHIPYTDSFIFHNLENHTYANAEQQEQVDYQTYLSNYSTFDYNTFDYNISMHDLHNVDAANLLHYVDACSITWNAKDDPTIDENIGLVGTLHRHIVTLVFKPKTTPFQNKNFYHGESSLTLLNNTYSYNFPEVGMNLFGAGIHVCLPRNI